MSVKYSTAAGHDEAGQVEKLLRYAAAQFDAHGIRFPHSNMVRLIRRTCRADGADYTRRIVDSYLDGAVHSRDWAGFELYAASGYKDPTGARAAQNVDLERGVA